ncbi:endonuclease/exonuclease/phosphatase family protein [Vibrio rarus]|uniref:endonuclease/exonuclease/phosphatase family protein n=1 Tax=Vibrio rarus TaxID=413403 RepID=UPI0021C3FFC6|nr:endonuclease/exonuclease/phosphatase family protein [Vibrio rarus]
MIFSVTKRLWLSVVMVCVLLAVLWFKFTFTVPEDEHLITTDGVADMQVASSFQCWSPAHASGFLDDNGYIDVLVWNIYKENRDNWQGELTDLIDGKQLTLLQEASLTDEFKDWLYQLDWIGQQVNAFDAFDVSAGVLNITHVYPKQACAQLDTEPWIQLPKSALFATYSLSNGEVLAVGNVHGINFTIGTKAYQEQLQRLADKLKQHQGPILLGGDFNSWSAERMSVLSHIMASVGLKEVTFDKGARTKFMYGHILDHIFYRDLQLIKAEAPTSDASDHNPMLAKFSINQVRH